MAKKFVVTPWEVSGEIDYDKLVKEFGTERVQDKHLEKFQAYSKGELHFMLERGLFFSHRDLDWLFQQYDKGNPFFLYTGRGPSGNTHLGHLTCWFLTKWLQDVFDCELWFQMTDDEKFMHSSKLSLKETNSFAYENALDVIALGFKPGKTKIFVDTDYAKTLYPQAIKVAKKITFSTVKAVFGFDNSTNVGMSFFTSMQAVPAFLPSVKAGKNIPCLIPHAIDQDPHFRVARDVLPKLGYFKPASIHCRFLPGLGEGGKMSASIPDSAIFTTDDEKTARKKVMNAFTGGRETAEKQRQLGGRPEICPIYQYYVMMFEKDEKKLKEIYDNCKSGKLLCGEDKKYLAELVVKFLKDHQKKREAAKKVLDKFIVKD